MIESLFQSSNSEKYFVVSFDGESPAQIFFDKKKAEESQARYIDSFDQYGQHVCTYRLVFNIEKFSYQTVK